MKKKNSDTVLAMKEVRRQEIQLPKQDSISEIPSPLPLPLQIKATHPLLGSTMAEKGNGIGQILSEVNIMKEQVRTHPLLLR